MAQKTPTYASLIHTKLITIPWHPIYSIAAGLLIGIGLQLHTPLGIALAICSLSIHLLFKMPTYKVPAFCLLGGLMVGLYHTQTVEHAYLRTCLASKQALNITGTVIQIQTEGNRQKTTIEIDQAYTKQRRTAHELIGWSIALDHPANDAITLGTTITCTNVYLRPPPLEKPFSKYCLQYHHLGHCKMREKPLIQDVAPQYKIRTFFQKKRAQLLQKIHTYTDLDTAVLIRSITLGDKEALKTSPVEYRALFQYWGISHYLARSGLHISTIMLLIMLICTYTIPLASVRLAVALLFSLLFSLLSYNSISYIRALGFVSLILIGGLRKRTTHALVLFAFVLSAILLHSPHALAALDFQLSFLLSGVLLWYNQIKFFQSLAKNTTPSIR
jgi:predicted membrane metal-binding protein